MQPWEQKLVDAAKAFAVQEATVLVQSEGKKVVDAALTAIEKVIPGAWDDALIESQRAAIDKAVIDAALALIAKLAPKA